MNVLKISEAVSIALHSLSFMARDGERCWKVKDLAREVGVSEAHLAKVFQRLVKVGILSSVRGPQGGFTLARPGGEITLLEVYEAVEAPLQEGGECLLRRSSCPFGECIFGNLVGRVNREFREYLASKTLGDIARGGR
jgi:Rrf2 family protein